MTGQFVRALGGVYHLDCFRCADCHCTVASKFFSSTEDMVGAARRPFPLCETDYFRRLDLLCTQCGRALRGSYITALGAKYHVEHFTCSVCPTVFGPNDSYYEHGGRVYCHFHYSTRFAIQCSGCHTAILKQFVEINRNNADEHWHPECYMIHRYWKIKLGVPAAPPRAIPLESMRQMPGALNLSPTSSQEALDNPEQLSMETLRLEATEDAESLLQKQRTMETRVFTIWRVLSAFEESSAACISDMLRHVSNGRYLGGVRYAGRFVLHVEVLFSAIDRLERRFQRAEAKSIQYVREARMLCKKIVNFFSLFSHTQATGARRMGITQELLSLVTGVAHYLKILIRISLTGALRLDQTLGDAEALESFLTTLDELVRQQNETPDTDADTDLVHGYTSLPRIRSHSADAAGESASDLCAHCAKTIEEECLRVTVAHRLHWGCVRCATCARGLLRPDGSAAKRADGAPEAGDLPAPVPLSEMRYRTVRRDAPPTHHRRGSSGTHAALAAGKGTAYHAYCLDCAGDASGCFVPVTRLEQYAFLLCVALNRLRALLRKKHASLLAEDAAAREEVDDASASEAGSELTVAESSTYRKSQEMKRLETLYLDRHMSTNARIPRYSTVVGSGGGGARADAPPPVAAAPPVPAGGGAAAGAAPPAPAAPAGGRRARGWSGTMDELESGGAERDVPLLNPWDAEASSAAIVSVRRRPSARSADEEREPTELGTHLPSEEGLTLADIPMILQAEQDREQLGGAGAAELRERRTYSSLSPEEMFVLKHLALVRLQQSALGEWVAAENLLELVDVRRNTFWGKLFKGGKERRDVRKKGVFGVSLEVLVERNGADSTLGATPTPMRIPSFVDDVVSAMRQMDVSVEGIFRKNGNVRRLKELAEAVDREQDTVNLFEDHPVQLAALLKKFFRELPDALLTARLHRLYILCQQLENEAERHRLLQLVTLLLPRAHRDTMEVLFVFLKWVASFSHVDEETGSRMDLPNLATVMCPNLLFSRSEPTRGEAILANRVVAHLLERQDDFWVVPEDMEAVLEDRVLVAAAPEMHTQELLRRCAKYA